MTRRVLLSLENASLATGVVAHLHQAGYGSVIVTDPEELVHQSVDADAVALVAQDRYLGDKHIDGILERLLAAL